jgi:hypothetical protein
LVRAILQFLMEQVNRLQACAEMTEVIMVSDPSPEMTPDILLRIQLWGIGREPLDLNTGGYFESQRCPT